MAIPPRAAGAQSLHTAGIREVAAAANVSTATVSRALRGLPRVSAATRQKVVAAASKLGYVPSAAASELARGRGSQAASPSLADIRQLVLSVASVGGFTVSVESCDKTDTPDNVRAATATTAGTITSSTCTVVISGAGILDYKLAIEYFSQASRIPADAQPAARNPTGP